MKTFAETSMPFCRTSSSRFCTVDETTISHGGIWKPLAEKIVLAQVGSTALRSLINEACLSNLVTLREDRPLRTEFLGNEDVEWWKRRHRKRNFHFVLWDGDWKFQNIQAYRGTQAEYFTSNFQYAKLDNIRSFWTIQVLKWQNYFHRVHTVMKNSWKVMKFRKNGIWSWKSHGISFIIFSVNPVPFLACFK